jgi:hypothetical protein
MRGSKCLGVIVLSIALMFIASVQAENPLDTVLLKNGSKILGNVTSARDGVIVIETNFSAAISIDTAEVQSIHTEGSMVVLMADGSTIRDQPIAVDKDGIEVTMPNGELRTYGVTDFDILNPEPWELGDGYKAFGLVSVAWALEEGNTVTDELDYKVESFWRSLEDRYTLKLYGELDEANGIKNADNKQIIGKYDYFLEGTNYWGGKFSAKQDEFADLDLRAYIGPYYGRQFYERRIFTLSGEFGLAYVTEDFIVAESQQYPGAHWDINLTSDYLGGDSKLYIEQSGIWNLENTDDVVLNTTFGLSFPLLGNLETAAEILLEYDTGAVEGVEELDQTYRFRIGYTW